MASSKLNLYGGVFRDLWSSGLFKAWHMRVIRWPPDTSPARSLVSGLNARTVFFVFYA